MTRRTPALLTLAALSMASLSVHANDIAYISSFSGYVLDNSGGGAVTAN